jgi:hypothetical protein
MAWLCSCGCVNSGTNKFCPASLTKTGVWKDRTHKQVSANSPDWVMAYLTAKEVGMTPQEELFAKFYNHEKVLVKDMDVSQLREHREELQKIAFEAKARLVAADDEARERKAKTNNKEWLVTDAKPDYDVSNAINVVKKRAERMSKMDKLRKQLETAGIDEATIKEMIGNLEKKATEGKLKTVTFQKPAVETSAVQVKVEKPVDDSPKVPFNPASLSFGK